MTTKPADKGETMGQRLRRLRDERSLSQSGLARLADVPLGTIRNWEQDRRIPRLDTAARVAKALNVSLDLIAEGVEADAQEQHAKPKKRRAR